MILLSLYDWIYSKYPSDLAYNGQWKPLHIIILLLAISSIVGISFLRKKLQFVLSSTEIIVHKKLGYRIEDSND